MGFSAYASCWVSLMRQSLGWGLGAILLLSLSPSHLSPLWSLSLSQPCFHSSPNYFSPHFQKCLLTCLPPRLLPYCCSHDHCPKYLQLCHSPAYYVWWPLVTFRIKQALLPLAISHSLNGWAFLWLTPSLIQLPCPLLPWTSCCSLTTTPPQAASVLLAPLPGDHFTPLSSVLCLYFEFSHFFLNSMPRLTGISLLNNLTQLNWNLLSLAVSGIKCQGKECFISCLSPVESKA